MMIVNTHVDEKMADMIPGLMFAFSANMKEYTSDMFIITSMTALENAP